MRGHTSCRETSIHMYIFKSRQKEDDDEVCLQIDWLKEMDDDTEMEDRCEMQSKENKEWNHNIGMQSADSLEKTNFSWTKSRIMRGRF
jgi:hypothetical protein